ncbi:MAG TPA: glycine cleavage system aminomethyltransferase GcvT [Anaerolineaceae bacterium]|nr:glycine cleavage system aminomethyltransferase GcvT [Anaerolineaceae bacterium]
MTDFLFRGSLGELDPGVFNLIQLESERQARRLIMIPSETTAPAAVRQALGSVFQNIYAEGYPSEDMRLQSEAEILNYSDQLSRYRRNSDPRYYKGVEYADIVESLARRRCAEVFATSSVSADDLYVNVQPLSGAPANNAVYNAFLNPGDTIMGMNLLHGGHLTHGSSVNRSGRLYNAIHYTINPTTEKIDYDAMEALALERKPKILIAGFSSYPWIPDWPRFRAVADACGAILMADISHIAGLVAAKLVASPVGYAQIITFTTHKTLCGPRGACILTSDVNLARKIDRAVFPGEQGGPHVQVFAALATTFMLAKTEPFCQLQAQIIKNCAKLVDRLVERGMRIPFGGTDSHLANLDCKTIVGPDGTTLSGDMAARIMDMAGIVVNRNTIPGDKTALHASGIRFGTPWITQRGLLEPEMVEIADIVADLLLATKPYKVETRQGQVLRAKVDFEVLENAKLKVRSLAEKAGLDYKPDRHAYPHYYYIDDKPGTKGAWAALDLNGARVRQFVNYAFSSDTETLSPGETRATTLSTPFGRVDASISSIEPNLYRVSVPRASYGLAATFLRGLSDGYISFDPQETRRLPGPIIVSDSQAKAISRGTGRPISTEKPYFIGMPSTKGKTLPKFIWQPAESELRKTRLNEIHRQMGAKMVPFAGWDMPVWYSSVVEEHLATRQAAGLFDVSHMGVYQAEGQDAAAFLDSVCGNDIGGLNTGESCYTHFLDPDANVIDDAMVYRRSDQKYLVVVNAANDDKDWAWLTSVMEGKVRIDNKTPWVKAFGRSTILRNLREPREAADMRVDIALQGPKSRDILLSLGCDAHTFKNISSLKRTELCEGIVGGFDLIISRSGYTGEKMAFELFVHPDQAVNLWKALIRTGAPYGLKPCGLGGRDSLRTEAGLPLYGQEMGGDLNLGVGEAGFGSYIKVYKPWFIGRDAFMEREASRSGVVIRFRFNEKGVRMAHPHDPVIDAKGRAIGVVTSCAIDSQGYLTGQAFVELKYSTEGTPIEIFQSATKSAGKAPAELKTGDRVTLPTAATVVSRFPKLT